MLSEKCRLFERQIEVTKEQAAAELAEKAETIKKLAGSLGSLEGERGRLQVRSHISYYLERSFLTLHNQTAFSYVHVHAHILYSTFSINFRACLVSAAF